MAQFSDMLGYLRKKAGLSQQELADKLNMSRSAIGMYETGKREPDYEALESIADFFNVNLDTLRGRSDIISDFPADLKFINDRLNIAGREEWVKYGAFLVSQPEYKKIADSKKTPVRLYTVPAAAGYASPVEGEDYEIVELDDVPPGTDYCIKVSGDSMEPYIRDGSYVYVKRNADLSDFDVGVFFLDGDVLVKQVVTDAFRNVYLLSANPKRADANRTIWHDSSSTLVCLGRVIIGKLPRPNYV